MSKLNKFLFGVLVGLLFTLLLNTCSSSEEVVVNHSDNKFGQFSDIKTPKYKAIIKLEFSKAFCSGWVIDKHYAVTAGHCLVDSHDRFIKTDIKIIAFPGQDTGINAKAVGYLERTDFGLIEGDFSNFECLLTDFHTYGFQYDKMYFACGYPGGDNHLSCNTFQYKANKYFLAAGLGMLLPGSSGGPVVNAQGVAVGIIHGVDNGFVLVAPLQGYLGAMDLE